MYPATLIAYAFVRKGMQDQILVTQMKLQKLVYFAHGYHLYKFDKPLIREEFQAWQFGPVVPSIYSDYKSFGRDPIEWTNKEYEEDMKQIDANAQQAIDYTWDVTKNLTAATLSSWTHQKGSPWDLVYSIDSWSIPIDNYVMKGYFKQLFEKVYNKNATHVPAAAHSTQGSTRTNPVS